MEPGDGSRRLTIPFESHLAGHAIGLWPLTSFVQPSQTVLMNAKFALWFFAAFILASSPVSAQSPCAECIKTVHDELKGCLDHAISVDDKNACEENRENGMRACEDKDCMAERESKELQRETVDQER